MRAALLLTVILLAGCANSGSHADWPGQLSPNPTTYDNPIVEKRWASASRAPLGSALDEAAILVALKKAHPDMLVREIRWISATEVMALVVEGGGLAGGEALYYGVLEKSGDSWGIEAWYDGSVA